MRKIRFKKHMRLAYLFLLSVLPLSQAAASEAYAVLSNSNTLITFYYDDLRTSRTGTTYSVATTKTTPKWNNQSIKTAVFTESFSGYRPTTTYRWFYYMINLTTIEGLEYLNTSEVTDMEEMFYACRSLKAIDLSHFETGNVANMAGMFRDCFGLTSLDLSEFDTHSATDMSDMFYSCKNLMSLVVSNFNTSSVTNMLQMFRDCEKLASLDVSSFNTANVTNMNEMFCGCSSLTSLDLRHFDTHNVTQLDYMFSTCKMLGSLDLSSFNTSNVTTMRSLFISCNELATVDLSSFNTQKVTDMNNMFNGCRKLVTLDVSSFDTHNVTNMSDMFAWCSNLTTIYASERWSVENVLPSGGRSLFNESINLVGGAGTAYSNFHVAYDYAHIDGGEENPGYFTGKADGEYIEVTIGSLKHVTMYYGKVNLRVPEGITATTYTIVDGDLQVSKTYSEGAVIPKGTGVVLYGEPNTYRLDVTTESGETDANNKLRGSDEEELTTGGDKYYILSTLKGSNGDPNTLGFYYANGHPDGSAFVNGAHKAYLALTDNVNTESKSFFLIDKISGIALRHGHSLRKESIYSINGQKTPILAKGIFIVNGKKIVIK